MTLWLQGAITTVLVVSSYIGWSLLDDFLGFNMHWTFLDEEKAVIEIAAVVAWIFACWYALHLIWGF